MVPQDPSAVRDETLRTIATFPRLPELLDDDQTSNLSPNCGGVNALTNQHDIFGEFEGGRYDTFPSLPKVQVSFPPFPANI